MASQLRDGFPGVVLLQKIRGDLDSALYLVKITLVRCSSFHSFVSRRGKDVRLRKWSVILYSKLFKGLVNPAVTQIRSR